MERWACGLPIRRATGLTGKDMTKAELTGATRWPELPRQVGAAVGAKRRHSPMRPSEHPRPRPAEMASLAPAQLKSALGDLDRDGFAGAAQVRRGRPRP
jgi:hypothetical protein